MSPYRAKSHSRNFRRRSARGSSWRGTRIPVDVWELASIEVAIGLIRAYLFLARDQRFELSLLDRLVGARGMSPLSRLDLRKHLLIGKPLKRCLNRRFSLSLLDQIVKV